MCARHETGSLPAVVGWVTGRNCRDELTLVGLAVRSGPRGGVALQQDWTRVNAELVEEAELRLQGLVRREACDGRAISEQALARGGGLVAALRGATQYLATHRGSRFKPVLRGSKRLVVGLRSSGGRTRSQPWEWSDGGADLCPAWELHRLKSLM